MALLEFNTRPTDRQLRQFVGLVLPAAALVAAAVAGWRLDQWGAAAGMLVLAALVALAGLVRPALARPLFLGWMYASYPIGWVLGHVLIGAVFFLVVTPIGGLMRVAGRDPLRRKFEPARSSYWERRTASDRTRYFRQF